MIVAGVKAVTTSMRAVRFHEFGGPEVLRCEEVARPEPGPGEVLIRVRAVGVNHLDLDLRAGLSRLPLTLPHTPGMEVAGEIAAVGPGVEEGRVGERVAVLYQAGCRQCRFCRAGDDSLCPESRLVGIHQPGGCAEFVAVEVGRLRSLPAGIDYPEAASFQVAMGAAWHALVACAGLLPGETLLVSAGGSGVGSAAIQIGRLMGARVIATAGGSEKAGRLRALGADVAIDHGAGDLAELVRAHTGDGVDAALEHVGGEMFGRVLECVRPNGRIVVLGGHAGEVVPLDLIRLFRSQWRVIGSRRATDAELETVLSLVAAGRLKPPVDRILPLGEAAEAHRLLETRSVLGKVVLAP